MAKKSVMKYQVRVYATRPFQHYSYRGTFKNKQKALAKAKHYKKFKRTAEIEVYKYNPKHTRRGYTTGFYTQTYYVPREKKKLIFKYKRRK